MISKKNYKSEQTFSDNLSTFESVPKKYWGSILSITACSK